MTGQRLKPLCKLRTYGAPRKCRLHCRHLRDDFWKGTTLRGDITPPTTQGIPAPGPRPPPNW